MNLAEALVSTTLPGRPPEFLTMDLFHLNGQTFLLVLDYYSRFPEVVTLRSTTAQSVIYALKSIFARHVISQEVTVLVARVCGICSVVQLQLCDQ